MDALVHYAHEAVHGLFHFYAAFRGLCLGTFPFAPFVLTGSNAINAALIGELTSNQEKGRKYWLHSLVLVIITGFGGGFLTPPLLGKPSSPLANEIIIPLCVLAWYAVHVLGVGDFLRHPFVKVFWITALAVFRVNSACVMIHTANQVLTPGPYYPSPLVGSIAAGTINGCAGLFFPLDQGLAAIVSGSSWVVQGAFLNSAFYHLMVYDRGLFGDLVRGALGAWAAEDVRAILCAINIATLLLQMVFSPEANLFTPVHKLLYLVFQVEGPKPAHQAKPAEASVGWAYTTRLSLERVLESLRVLVVVLAIVAHLYVTTPDTRLSSGTERSLARGQRLGVCQQLAAFRGCSPRVLWLHRDAASGQHTLQSALGSGNGNGNTLLEADWSISLNTTVATSGKSKKDNKKDQPQPENAVLRLGSDGVLRLVSASAETQQETLLWANAEACAPTTNTGAASVSTTAPYLTIETASGEPIVVCGPDKPSLRIKK